MGHPGDRERSRLAALQDLVSGSGQVLLGGAQTIAEGLQRRLSDVGRDVSSILESGLREALDDFIARLALSIRREIEKLADRVASLEQTLAGLPAGPLAEVVNTAESLAQQAIESAAASNMHFEELSRHLQALEERLGQGEHPAAEAEALEKLGTRLEELREQAVELGKEVGTRVSEIGALDDRLHRLERRVAEQARGQAACAEDLASFRERLGRLEGRLSDLSREQIARTVEAAAVRERLLRLEQRFRTSEASPAGSPETAHDEDAR